MFWMQVEIFKIQSVSRPGEMVSGRPSHTYAKLPAYLKFMTLDDLGLSLNHQCHFALFEIGFNPLTLLVATHQDYKNLYRHYQGVTSIIKELPSKLRAYVKRECMQGLQDCIMFRSHVLFLLDDLRLSNPKTFETQVSKNPCLQEALLSIMRDA